MSAAFHVRDDDEQRPGDRVRVLMVVEFRFLTRCVIVGNFDAVIDDLCESAIMGENDERESEEIGRYLRQGESDRLSPAYLPHNDCVRFEVAELEERADCMCLRFETATLKEGPIGGCGGFDEGREGAGHECGLQGEISCINVPMPDVCV